jgi:amino acid transporter
MNILSAFLQLSNDAAVVIQWYVPSPKFHAIEFLTLRTVFRFVNLVTASQLLNYAIISLSYIRFHKVRVMFRHIIHAY